MHRYLKAAINQALEHDYEENIEYKLCALIVGGGNVISVGFNQRKTNSFVEHYTDLVRGCGRGYCLSTHAEMHAVMQARNKTDLRGCKVFVARIRPSKAIELVGCSRPCPVCEKVLRAYGVRKAYYTIDDYQYGIMTIGKNNSSDKIISFNIDKRSY